MIKREPQGQKLQNQDLRKILEYICNFRIFELPFGIAITSWHGLGNENEKLNKA